MRPRTYRYEGGHFERANEVAQTPTLPAGQKAAQGSVASVRAADPPTPAQGKGGDLSKQLFEQFKRDRNLAASVTPTTDIQVHVADDPRPERVVLMGNDIVVFGPGFKGGQEYAFISLSQFASGSVKELTARDLNGDGAADLVVRGTRVVQPGQGSVADVVSEATFVYALRDGAIQRIFAIETAREQGKDRVQGLVQFVPSKSGKGFDIDVRPARLRVHGEVVPGHQEQPGNGIVEPLLLPWAGSPVSLRVERRSVLPDRSGVSARERSQRRGVRQGSPSTSDGRGGAEGAAGALADAAGFAGFPRGIGASFTMLFGSLPSRVMVCGRYPARVTWTTIVLPSGTFTMG